MDTFTAVFYYLYIAVSLFYIICGVILLLKPTVIEPRLKSLFPLLESFKYRGVTNSVNLIFVGCVLLAVVKLMEDWSVVGLFIAVVLSGLEVYLGVKFYYHEKNDMPQAIIHVVLHTIIVGVVIFFMVFYLSSEINLIQNQTGAIINSLSSWTAN
jgi:uncharacterized membrane protein